MSTTAALGAAIQAPVLSDARPSQKVGNTDFKSLLSETVSDPAPQTKNDPKKVADAARQFEALMIGQLLKNAREESSDGWLGSGEDSSAGTATDMAQEFFGRALADAGGLGIAKVVTANLSRR